MSFPLRLVTVCLNYAELWIGESWSPRACSKGLAFFDSLMEAVVPSLQLVESAEQHCRQQAEAQHAGVERGLREEVQFLQQNQRTKADTLILNHMTDLNEGLAAVRRDMQKYTSLTADKEALEERVAFLQTETERLQSATGGKSAELKTLESKISALHREYRASKKVAAQLHEERRAFQKENSELHSERSKLQESIKVVQEELGRFREESAQKSSEISSLKREIQSLDRMRRDFTESPYRFGDPASYPAVTTKVKRRAKAANPKQKSPERTEVKPKRSRRLAKTSPDALCI
ncbi:MAG: hypothetical protein KVP17_005064 [Porospora cf. gigantea B]|uniref:uncharacterized protein n=1 Tax=Porospora cf. gigantea B TaxID=2853592 RepID=UPI003571A96F|nr:MAG: hypothetical protein KVP17_005064 [Porospora cf. gigantea B]